MTLTNDQRNIAVGLLIEKSHRNMEQAVKNAGLDYWDLVANRLYYSLFHAVTALMLADGIKTSTHKGTSSQFGRYYVLTGKFSREDGMLYSRLQTMRERADYQNTFNLTPEQGSELIAKADDLQKRIVACALAR
ncbi:HEPN domain-containing protein [uncultured Duncaniella sp.]|uniref:HEPN domain-containing protein n=1 Tax=uncultured Duncaniella sp. TaxID=2768039 RepID=UPI00273182E8|nr:HEPN domain-containing protein [uncultured Duncaniella sp.]